MIDWLRRDPGNSVLRVGGRDVPIVIRRHARARRMILRLAQDGASATVTLPPWGRTADALAFASSRTDWLAEQLGRVPQREPPSAGGRLLYRGRALAIEWSPKARRTPLLVDDSIVLGGPEAGIGARVGRWLEKEALRLIQADLADYCAGAGIAAPALRLSRAKRRWGSCAGDGTIRINWRLVQAPDAVRRSVVAHEVAHLVHFDHSPAFHALLGTLFEGDVAAANRWLKREGRSLYAAFG